MSLREQDLGDFVYPRLNEYTVKWEVWFKVDQQSFRIGDPRETQEEAEFMAKMLRKALRKLILKEVG